MVKQSKSIDKEFRRLTSIAGKNVTDESIGERLLYKLSDSTLSDRANKYRKESDTSSPYNIFLRGVNFQEKAEGREIFYHKFGREVFFFYGPEEVILEKLRRTSDEETTMALLSV
jgi:hypothetical protein